MEYPCNHCWSRNIACVKNSRHRKCANCTRHGIPCGVPFISGVGLNAFLKDEACIGVQLQETQDEINFLSSQLSTAVTRFRLLVNRSQVSRGHGIQFLYRDLADDTEVNVDTFSSPGIVFSISVQLGMQLQ
jgi:hypothetical protein